MKYSKSNANTVAIVFAICTITAIALGTFIRFHLASGEAETVEKSKEEKDSTADMYQIE